MQKKKRISVLFAVIMLLLTACVPLPQRQQSDAAMPPSVQTYGQLQLDETQPVGSITAAWMPYFITETLFDAADEQACRDAVRTYLKRLQDCGVNTVFVHVCAFGESGYPSAYYPPMPEANGHDEMQILTDICAELGLSLHAWINPLRLQTEEYMNEQTGDAMLCTWYRDEAVRAGSLSLWDGRYYLNPAAESTRIFLSDVITELMTRYHPAGVHIDDYFYPTTETAWDADAFAASGASDLATWRRENITELVQEMYKAVHEADENAVFSISPQGNLSKNHDELYADIPAWMTAGNCCDLIVPQLYFGYQNEICPYTEMLRAWCALLRAENVSLAVGIGAYKSGEADELAGIGEREWITTPDIVTRQTADALAYPDVCGIAFYHSDALLSLPDIEKTGILSALNGK